MDTRLLYVDFIVILMVAFDVILGMDWLSAYRAVIDCVGKTVKFLIDDHEKNEIVGLGSSIICLQVIKLLNKGGCTSFLALVSDVNRGSNVQLQNIEVVQEYPDVFADDVPGLPPDREVEFVIELSPGTAPISNAPYIMAPTKLKELTNQLQELLDKGFIRLSSSPWGAPVLFVKKKDGSLRLCIDYRELNKTRELHSEHLRIVLQILKEKQLYAKLKKLLPFGTEDFVVYTDASKQGLGAVLMQRRKMVAYASRKLKEYEKNYPTHDLELAAVLKNKSDLTEVSEFGLNRDGLLTFRGRICVPMGNDNRKDVLIEDHTLPYLVHPSNTKMYQDLRRLYWWPDMLRACTIDFTGSWDSKLPLVEFTYNNSYQSSIGMVPYEALYRRKCRSPLYWEEVGERKILGPELVQQTADVVALIQERMKTAQSRQKSYADVRRRPFTFEVGDHVFIKIAPLKGVMRFGKKGKLSPRYIGPFEILDKIGDQAYRLAMPPDLDRMHNVFHVSMLRKYLPNPSHILRYESLDLLPNLNYEEVPVQILDRKVKVLRNKEIGLVKFLWRNHMIEEATWKPEEEMKHCYPNLFDVIHYKVKDLVKYLASSTKFSSFKVIDGLIEFFDYWEGLMVEFISFIVGFTSRTFKQSFVWFGCK
ncbi:uncharacterized protein LOC142550638 [Primulina tabacum]|uniref:uncharacterized protein LOC142550638 n=1 Tax=Primulina tabacum TaxID=48773 RepID=UPI003F5ACF2E